MDISNLQEGFIQGTNNLDTLRFFKVDSVPLVWLHNLRVIALASIFGLFSFG
jgi:hypothetical protein